MDFVENNNRPGEIRSIMFLQASRGAEAAPSGHGRALPAGLGGTAPRDCPWPLGGPQVALWSLASSWRIKQLCKFLCTSKNISRSGFFEIENNKNKELALGILSIG